MSAAYWTQHTSTTDRGPLTGRAASSFCRILLVTDTPLSLLQQFMP